MYMLQFNVFEYHAISAAVLIFGLDNEEQHIFTFGATLVWVSCGGGGGVRRVAAWVYVAHGLIAPGLHG